MYKPVTGRNQIPFGLSPQQVKRLQRILDCDGAKPADLAAEWGISIAAANKDVARMREKVRAKSMSELLTKAQRAGVIAITHGSGQEADPIENSAALASCHVAEAENVHCRVLDSGGSLSYNVPDLLCTRFTRASLFAGRQGPMSNFGSDDAARPLSVDRPRITPAANGDREPASGFMSIEECDRNNGLAISIGLPAVSSRMLNAHGIEWVIDGYIHTPTPDTAWRWREGRREQPQDLYPSIIPQNLSDRLTSFVSAVDRCTAKTFVLLDTTPELRRSSVPGYHALDTASNCGTNLIFLDAARVHETVLAHEIGHAWVQYVEGCEDERVMDDVSDPPRLNQLNFVQSFVLDMKVNEILRRKGFDMAPIETDVAASVVSLCRAIEAGYRPPNRREEVFMGLLLATALLDGETSGSRLTGDSGAALVRFQQVGDNLLQLGRQFAGAVREHGHSDRASIRMSIDQCLTVAFQHTGDGIDLERELLELDREEPNFDKYPAWISGAPVKMKCEIGRIMALEDIPDGSRWRLSDISGGQTRLEFELPDGTGVGDWVLNYPFPPGSRTTVLDIKEINRRNRERIASQFPPAFGQPRQLSPQVPRPGKWRRHYMAGLGRFLTQARLQEQLMGEHPYGYAANNPATYVDPSGMDCGQHHDGSVLVYRGCQDDWMSYCADSQCMPNCVPTGCCQAYRRKAVRLPDGSLTWELVPFGEPLCECKCNEPNVCLPKGDALASVVSESNGIGVGAAVPSALRLKRLI